MLTGGRAAGAANATFVSGSVFDATQSSPRQLSPDNLLALAAWIDRHQSGWRLNVATHPVPLMHVTLNTPAKQAAVCLSLWPSPQRTGWSHAVIMEQPAGYPMGIQTLNGDELTALMHALK